MTEIIPPPTPRMDLKLNTSSSDKSDHDSASINTTPTTRSQERDFTYLDDAESLRTEGKGSEVAAGNEKQAYGINRDEGSSRISKAQSVTSTTESNIVYPSRFRALLIVLSLSLSTFLVALDRTIVPTAM